MLTLIYQRTHIETGMAAHADAELRPLGEAPTRQEDERRRLEGLEPRRRVNRAQPSPPDPRPVLSRDLESRIDEAETRIRIKFMALLGNLQRLAARPKRLIFELLILLGLLWLYIYFHTAARPPQTLIQEATGGTLPALKEKIAPWATHWATVEGRLTLRLAAVEAARAGHKNILTYLCLYWKVPVNSVPEDEQSKYHSHAWKTPL